MLLQDECLQHHDLDAEQHDFCSFESVQCLNCATILDVLLGSV